MVRAEAWDNQAYLKGMGRSLAPPPGVTTMPQISRKWLQARTCALEKEDQDKRQRRELSPAKPINPSREEKRSLVNKTKSNRFSLPWCFVWFHSLTGAKDRGLAPRPSDQNSEYERASPASRHKNNTASQDGGSPRRDAARGIVVQSRNSAPAPPPPAGRLSIKQPRLSERPWTLDPELTSFGFLIKE